MRWKNIQYVWMLERPLDQLTCFGALQMSLHDRRAVGTGRMVKWPAGRVAALIVA